MALQTLSLFAATVLALLLAYSGAFKLVSMRSFIASWAGSRRHSRKLLKLLPVLELALAFTIPFYLAPRLATIGLLAALDFGRRRLFARVGPGCGCGAPGLSRLGLRGARVYMWALVALALVASAQPDAKLPVPVGLGLAFAASLTGIYVGAPARRHRDSLRLA